MHLRPFQAALKFAIAIVVAGIIALPAFGADRGAETMLRNSIDEVLTIAYSNPGKAPTPASLRPSLEKCFAFELVTRQVIGAGWKQFSDADRKRVTNLFTELLIRTYARRVIGTKRPKIVYGSPIEVAPGRQELPTRVTTSSYPDPFPVTYRITKLPEGWRIYDIVVEGVSFVANYRSQFAGIVQKGGAPAVIQSLETKLASPPNT
ncbi:MAG TPA: ABC transporter substrate-binding protein [Chthoniobacterales bacterium]